MVSWVRSVRYRLKTAVRPSVFTAIHNLHAWFAGLPRVRYVPNTGRMRVYDASGSIEICRRLRVSLYRRSVAKRLADLQHAYLLDALPVMPGEAFIDCGANVGELGWFAREHGLDYHAFEPEPLEADCCDANNFSGAPHTNRVALWSETTQLSFFSKPETADGSVVEIDGYDRCFVVPATTLDAYVARAGITAVAVLKIEAEGAEPEVLLGAERTLAITRYVAVDCGFERGKAHESTAAPVINFLLERGFRVRDWNAKRVTFLFDRTGPADGVQAAATAYPVAAADVAASARPVGASGKTT